MKKRPKQASEAIPIDLLIDIFSRVPAKSIARFRCMSKQWASILHHQHFTELFLTVSSARPLLLFAIQDNGTWHFLSTPQPLNLGESLSPLVAYQYKPFQPYFSRGICAPVRGLICTQSRKPMICNPSTGQYVTLPKAASKGIAVQTLFGYYLINQIFKVLSVFEGYRVLTLGMGQLSWRTIHCWVPHFPFFDGICIDGILYYLAWRFGKRSSKPCVVVCFDVRFETFKFLDVDIAIRPLTLINYKGKLGVIKFEFPRIQLSILDDANVNKWSEEHNYVLSPLWNELAVYIVGMAPTGEIVLASCYTLAAPFCIFYYNMERNTIVTVKIKLGIEAFKHQRIYTFVEHIENVKPMQLLRRL